MCLTGNRMHVSPKVFSLGLGGYSDLTFTMQNAVHGEACVILYSLTPQAINLAILSTDCFKDSVPYENVASPPHGCHRGTNCDSWSICGAPVQPNVSALSSSCEYLKLSSALPH